MRDVVNFASTAYSQGHTAPLVLHFMYALYFRRVFARGPNLSKLDRLQNKIHFFSLVSLSEPMQAFAKLGWGVGDSVQVLLEKPSDHF